jgi:uncharacterized protein
VIRGLAAWALLLSGGLLGACGSSKPYDPVTEDPPVVDKDFPIDWDDVRIASGGVELFGRLRMAQGKGPHPTVVAARGFPDPESNIDLMLALPRAGFNTLSFYYRGYWGMGGTYTMRNSYEDLKAAIAFLKSDEAVAKFRVDRNRLIVLGTSGGGPISVKAASENPEIRALILIDPVDMRHFKNVSQEEYDSWVKEYDSTIGVHVSGKDAMAETMPQVDFWDPVRAVPGLSRKCVLAVMATRGPVADWSVNIKPPTFAEAMRSNERFSVVTLDTDHAFGDHRIALMRTIVSWAQGLPSKSCL